MALICGLLVLGESGSVTCAGTNGTLPRYTNDTPAVIDCQGPFDACGLFDAMCFEDN